MSPLLTLAWLLILAISTSSQSLARCGTVAPPDEELLRIHDAHKEQSLERQSRKGKQSKRTYSMKVFPLAFHIFEDTGKAIVNVPDSVILTQVQVVNDAFAGLTSRSSVDTKIRVVLRSVSRITDDMLATTCLLNPTHASTIAEDEPDVLHVFICNLREVSRKIGQAQLPCPGYPEALPDGMVWIDSSSLVTVPGFYTARAPYDRGMTLVHELGHVFGLLHTFHGDSCLGDGDFIDDTPPEAFPNNGPCEDRDTCPVDRLLDPIENFMDYSDDTCMDRFTPNQVERMHAEIERCLQSRYLPVRVERRCRISGSYGTAPVDAECSSVCSTGRFPSGTRNGRKIKWCWTNKGQWGGVCKCSDVQAIPTDQPTADSTLESTVAPSASPSRLPGSAFAPSAQPTTSPRPTASTTHPSKKPSTDKPLSVVPSTTRPRSLAPSNGKIVTTSPLLSPSMSPILGDDIVCEEVTSQDVCKSYSRCRYMGLSEASRQGLSQQCLASIGCKSVSSFCDGLCLPVCLIKWRHCEVQNGICTSI